MGGGNNKTVAVSVASSLCVILAWVVKEKLHVDIPGDVQSAIQGLLSIGVVFLVPHSASSGQAN